MAVFNPETQDVNPDWTGASKGTIPDKSLGTLFEGIGEVIGQSATIADEYHTNKIRDEFTKTWEGLNAPLEDPALNPSVGSQQPRGEVKGAPPEITQSESRLTLLKKAYDQGVLNDTAYYSRLHSEVRKLRARYPGYTEDIDTIVSKVTSQSTANAVRSALANEWEAAQRAISGSADQATKYLIANDEDLFDVPNKENMSLAELMAVAAPRKARRTSLQQTKSELELKAAQGKATQEDATQVATQTSAMIVDNVLTSSVWALTGETNDANILASIDRLQKSGPISAETAQALSGTLQNALVTAHRQFEVELNKPLPSGGTLRALLGPEGVTKQKQMIDESFKPLLQAATDKDMGLLAQGANYLAMAKNDALRQIFGSPDGRIWLGLGAVKEVAGDIGVSTMMANQEVSDAAVRGTLAITNPRFFLSGDQALSYTVAQENFQKARVTDPKAYESMLNSTRDALLATDVTDRGVANFVTNNMSLNQKNFLAAYNDADGSAQKVAQRMMAPAVTERIARAAKAHPEIMNTYAEWAKASFASVLKADISELAQARETSDNLDVQWDDKRKQFVYKATNAPGAAGSTVGGILRTSPIVGPVAGLMSGYNSVVTDQAAIRSINNVNRFISNLVPIMEANNEDPTTAITNLMAQAGFDVNAPREGSIISRMINAVSAGAEGFVEDLSSYTVTPASGDESEPLAGLTFEDTPDNDRIILDFIAGPESGNLGYDAVAGGRLANTATMTIQQAIEGAPERRRNGAISGAIGRYQFMPNTLKMLINEGVVKPDEFMTPDVQDRMALALAEKRGLSLYREGSITKEEFANRLAKEWAGLPVVTGPKKGRSYYDGDGLNKSGVSVDQTLGMLDAVR